jgi:hypothetical protein
MKKKKCPICDSSDLDMEETTMPASAAAKMPGKLVPAVAYVCNECGCEFLGVVGGGGLTIQYDPRE